MMDYFLLGIIVFFGAYMANRFIMTEAMKKLDDSMKLSLIDVFSRRNNLSTIVLFGLILMFFGALQFFKGWAKEITIVYATVYFVYLSVKLVVNYGTLKELGLPAGYIRSFLVSLSLVIVGFIALFSGVYFSLLR